MKFFDFFRKTNLKGKEDSIASQNVPTSKKNNPVSASKKKKADLIQTPLSLHPDWNITQEQMYVFRFLANDLSPLRANQISLQGIDIDENEGNWLVKGFVRTTVEQMIEIGQVELILLDKENQMIGHQSFDFSELGDLPSNTARPWVFEFRSENIFVEDIPEDGWKLAFNTASLVEHALDVDPRWQGDLSNEQRTALEQLVAQLEPMKGRQINFTGFSIEPFEEGYGVMTFIRSSHPKTANLEQLPLQVVDANHDIVAEGVFTLDPPLEIRSNTSKPWTFIFPKETVKKEDPDLSRWAVRISPNADNLM